PLRPRLQSSGVRPRLRPVVADYAVPRRDATFAAAHEHVLAEDALELGRERRQSGPGPLVRGVRLELDEEVALVLECVPQEEVLRLGVRTRSPRFAPRLCIADLHHAYLPTLVDESSLSDGHYIA